VRAALGAGLTIGDCREPTFPESAVTGNAAYQFAPDAVREAFEGLPFLLVWRAQRPDS
jgi:hypothetical protein